MVKPKHFFPSKSKKRSRIEEWIPEVKELRLQKTANLKNKSGSKKDLVCLQCRKTGHSMRKCPQNKKGGGSSRVCYKCGSPDHSVHDCTEGRWEDADNFRFASCFVCGEKGHISRECPKNQHGIYVNGGCCKACKGTDHLYQDCPNRGPRSGGWRSRGGTEDDAAGAAGTHTQFGGDKEDNAANEKKRCTSGPRGDDLEDDFVEENLSDAEEVDEEEEEMEEHDEGTSFSKKKVSGTKVQRKNKNDKLDNAPGKKTKKQKTAKVVQF